MRPSLSLSLNFSASKVENMFKKQFKIDTSICAIISYLTVLIFHIENDFFNGQTITLKNSCGDFPGGTVVKNLPANAGDTGSSPGPGRSHMTQSN